MLYLNSLQGFTCKHKKSVKAFKAIHINCIQLPKEGGGSFVKQSLETRVKVEYFCPTVLFRALEACTYPVSKLEASLMFQDWYSLILFKND